MPEPEKVEFSKEHEEKMRKIFKKERNKLFFKKISKYSKRVAIFFLRLLLYQGLQYSVLKFGVLR